jgi:hypothetical protein
MYFTVPVFMAFALGLQARHLKLAKLLISARLVELHAKDCASRPITPTEIG